MYILLYYLLLIRRGASAVRCRYDEPALLKEVEKRLGRPIERLDDDLKAPDIKPAGPVVYGQAKGGGHSKVRGREGEGRARLVMN
eukprot:615430-Prorocentrum_minimum.AAC.1